MYFSVSYFTSHRLSFRLPHFSGVRAFDNPETSDSVENANFEMFPINRKIVNRSPAFFTISMLNNYFQRPNLPRLIFVFLFLFAGVLSSAQQKVSLFSRSAEPLPAEARKGLSKGQRLIPSLQAIRDIYESEPDAFQLEIPLEGGGSKQFVLHKTKVVSDDFRVTTSDGKEFRGKKFSGVHYQIRPGLQEEKVGAFSFTEQEVAGLFSDKEGNWNLGLLPEGKGDYIVYCEKDLLVNSGFHCGTEDEVPPPAKKGQKQGNDKSVQSSGNCKVVKMYFECDFRMYQDNGSSTANTTAKITSMFNMVQQMFSNEQINIELNQVFVWTTTDPYATTTPSGNVLTAFTNNRQAITQNLGHLVSTRPASMGGIAWLDVVCNPWYYAYRFGFSNIYNTFSAVPTYSWSVYCMTHEIGHNFGSNHTHWCGWTGGALDNCYTTEPNGATTCSSGPSATGGGTIMSYCHLTANGVNFTKGFGTQPGNRIRTGFACITGSPVPSFSLNSNRTVCTGSNINLTASSTTSGATFAWTGPNGFTSTQQNPVVNSVTAAAGGNYACAVTAAGCTSDPKTIAVVVNNPISPPLSEGFTASIFPPAGWRISNPNDDVTWVRNTSVGGFGTSSNSIAIDNYNFPFTTNKRDTLFLPVLNLTGQSSASLTFDVAHAWNGTAHDTLCVIVSSNCGRTFQRLYKKSGSSLSTAPSTFNQFVPSASQWRKETINLGAFDGQGQVQVAFAVFSGASNMMYIDNINITSTGGGGSNSITLNPLSQSSFCPGQSLSVGFTGSGTFDAANSFSVQLSNASGSFASPTVIGTGTSSPVAASIPAAVASGAGYLIRMVSSSPVATSPPSSAFSIAPLTVSAGADQSLCSNASSITLSGTPAGGTWTGSGVTAAGVFTPTAGLVGNQTLTYSASSGACSGSDQVVVNVTSIPSVNAGTDQNTCSQSAPFALSGFSPAGGSWSGNGVSATGTFTPSSGLIGNNSLTYSFTQNGCTNTDVKVVAVSASVTVSAGASQSLCSNAAAITLNGTPSGGTWSGNGVSASGVFTPSSSLVGDNLLTYSVPGACAGNAQTTVTVTSSPVVSAGIARIFCAADAATALTQGTPAGGTWSGTGVSNGNFDPAVAGTGNFTLTYTAGSGSCTASSSVQFSVNANPVVNIPAIQPVCSNGSPVTLTATPSGGTWSGPGVSSSGIFTPASALTGTRTLTYQLTVNGCAGSGTSTVTVNAAPVANAGSDRNVLVTDADFTLSGSPAGGTWTGPGVSADGQFSPQTSGSGTYTLSYSVSVNNCSDVDQLVVVVNSVEAVSAGADQTVCSDGATIQLSGVPAGGTWSGNGVSASGLFTPSSSLIGVQTLTYTVAGAGSDALNISVAGPPVVSAGADQSVCSASPDFTLSGSPAGGTWTGNGITAAGLVSVASLSAGVNSFTYTASESGCSNSDVLLITIVNPPVVNAGNNQSICLNAENLQLGASPAGGSWTGTGVSAGGLFSPSSAGIGSFSLTYALSGTLPGCDGSDNVTITVKALPVVVSGNNRSTCANASPFALSGSPAGGTWSGSGVSASGLFIPSASLTGIQLLVYSATQNGCSASDTLAVTVNALPVASAGLDKTICTSSPTFSLGGFTPSGGVWSGPAFVNQSGQCTAPFASGTYTLTYTVTQNGCTGTDQLVLTVTPSPTVNAGSNKTVCANAPDLTLTGFSPAGGTWSGNGVSPQGVFSPSVSLVGTQTLTYTVVSGGCSGTDQMNVSVKAIPAVAAGADESTCASAARFKIGGFSPRGGQFSGPGVVLDSLYQPSVSLLGQQTLTYTFTKNGCSNSDQKIITVNPSNTITPSSSNPASVCAAGQSVTLACSPTGGVWKGSGVTSAGVFTPSAALIGNRTLFYRLDQGGCRDSVAVQIQVNANPVVNAGSDISACSAGSPVQLTGFSPAGGTWSGQGVTSAGVFSPATVSPGNIVLTYTFTENGCSGSDQLQISVSSSPPVNAGANRSICQNSESIQLSASPLGGTWSGTGVTASGLFTPASGMSSPLQLTYTLNQNGCTGTDQVQITLSNALAVNAGNDQSLCSNDAAVNLAGFSPSGGTWSGPGVSAAGVFTPSPSLSGNQTLTYRINQTNCKVTDQKVVEVKAAPEVSAGADQNVCSNDAAAVLTGFSPAGGTWTGTGVSPNGIIQLSQAGAFSITYSVTLNGCTATDQKLLSIIEAPQVEAGANQTICGLLAPFSISGSFPAGGTWTGNGVDPAGLFTPAAGMLGSSIPLAYIVTQNNCTAADTVRILVLDIPASVTTSSSSSAACLGELINLGLDLGGSVSPFIFQWKKDGALIPGANAPLYAASVSGVYNASVSLAACSINSSEKSLQFNPLPETPVITQVDSLLTSSAASGNQWKRNGQDIPGATQQTYIVLLPGTYTVVVSNLNCLSSPSNAIVISPTSAAEMAGGKISWQMLPNPARDQVQIRCNKGGDEGFDLQLLDATGRKVRTFQGRTNGTESQMLDISGLPSGLYWLQQAGHANGFGSKRLMIQ